MQYFFYIRVGYRDSNSRLLGFVSCFCYLNQIFYGISYNTLMSLVYVLEIQIVADL